MDGERGVALLHQGEAHPPPGQRRGRRSPTPTPPPRRHFRIIWTSEKQMLRSVEVGF